MSIANKGKQKSLGRIHSEETKRKLSIASTGQKPNNNIPVVQYTKSGAFVMEYSSAERAGIAMGEINGAGITMVCKIRKNRKTSKGFIWKYKKDVLDESGNILMNVHPIKERFTSEQKRDIAASKLTNVQLGEMYGTSSTTIFFIKKKYKNEH